MGIIVLNPCSEGRGIYNCHSTLETSSVWVGVEVKDLYFVMADVKKSPSLFCLPTKDNICVCSALSQTRRGVVTAVSTIPNIFLS